MPGAWYLRSISRIAKKHYREINSSSMKVVGSNLAIIREKQLNTSHKFIALSSVSAASYSKK